ncbi:putative acetylxylan esterase A [Cytospora mali]|uniref:Acetylxylan esterase A n=1 Tax=Cytospora mali TaxID=578113 RepID=A0A194VLM5_CYTMA|nr:putative acetylxylan esterase A [Valsa mali]
MYGMRPPQYRRGFSRAITGPIFTKQPPRIYRFIRTNSTMTTGVFRYIDPATITQSEDPFIKPWAKVDTDATSFERTERKRSVANIRDAIANGTEFGIDISGFAVYHYPSKVRPEDFLTSDDSEVRKNYYAEVEQLLREKLGPGLRKVAIFDHTVRKHDPGAPRQPVQQVHVDQTPKAAEARVRRHLPAEEADELLKGRYQLINVWRPIGYPASDFPLAVVDWRTTAPQDLVKVDLLYPTRNRGLGDGNDDRGKEILPDPEKAKDTTGYEVKGETYSVAPNETHKFYYMKDMSPDEAMFIKCFDSGSQGHPNGRDGIAQLTPHTAFIDPATPKDAKGRQSIEVRCLVFYE